MIHNLFRLSPDHDKRLLPRLLAMLDTLDDSNEIAVVVRHIRRIAGPAAFSTLGDTVSCQTDEHSLTVRLRSLGIALSRMHEEGMTPQTAHAVAATSRGLMEGGTIRKSDLLLCLAVMRDLLEAERAATVDSAHAGHADLRAAMEALSELIVRR